MRIFVDMDGTIAKWQNVSSEALIEDGYFRNLPPMRNTLDAIKFAIINGDEVKILSSVLGAKQQADKVLWLKQFLPELSEDNFIFVKYGDNKSDYIKDKRSDDMLLDDYSVNLHSWYGIGVKCLNGINGTHGTWKGRRINANSHPLDIFNMLHLIYCRCA